MTVYEKTREGLTASAKEWLVTGVAGFIGSHLLEALLQLGQRVVGLDNFSTGHRRNLEDVRQKVGEEAWTDFTEVEADIRDLAACEHACQGADYVLHQAALGSVPRSISNPIATNQSNVSGFVNMIWAAKEARVKRFVFASSSSVYGDDPALPRAEEQLGNCLSPYAVSKRVNELYADAFSKCYGMEYIGLRYFNVFGRRQDPDGPYAAVVPKWIAAMIQNEPVYINGDGETSRDFCYVTNVVQANLLAAITPNTEAVNQVFNVAVGERTALNELFNTLRRMLLAQYPHLEDFKPVYREFRSGDVRHSHADISKARRVLGYQPTHRLAEGLEEALDSYVGNSVANKCAAVAQ